jgi:hypothetical protein
MEHVAFTPWVGEGYAENGYNGKKILVLGESHYCGDCDSCKMPKDKCSITINVITEYLNYKNGKGEFANCMNTYTKFTNVFFGEKCGNETVNNFWNSIIFYNYVQKSVEGARESPTQQMFQESEAAFFEILNEYNPDIIIVWGERLWNNLPGNGYWAENYVLDESGGKFYYYKGKTKNIPAYRIYHPSTSYFNYEHTKYLKEVMSLI